MHLTYDPCATTVLHIFSSAGQKYDRRLLSATGCGDRYQYPQDPAVPGTVRGSCGGHQARHHQGRRVFFLAGGAYAGFARSRC